MLRQFSLGKNLPAHIRENTNFSPQLPSAKANFKGCNRSVMIPVSNQFNMKVKNIRSKNHIVF